jgi:hypothetical protein
MEDVWVIDKPSNVVFQMESILTFLNEITKFLNSIYVLEE